MQTDCQIINASDFPEFFYKDSNCVVSEGQPVGVEIERNSYVEFILFDYIYWCPPNE
jgi:hypothetical protein